MLLTPGKTPQAELDVHHAVLCLPSSTSGCLTLPTQSQFRHRKPRRQTHMTNKGTGKSVAKSPCMALDPTVPKHVGTLSRRSIWKEVVLH
jgi:hypothetical protein